MKVAIMQPYIFPYIGYFQLINAVDTFVVYDNIKFTKKGWINRNRILVNGKDEYFSIPLKKDSDFLDVDKRRLAENFKSEKSKLLRKVTELYRKAPEFNAVYPLVESALNNSEENLFSFIYDSLVLVCSYIDIRTKLVISSTIKIDHQLKAQEKVIAICKALNASQYINPAGGVELYSKEIFREHNIELSFIQSGLTEYSQFKNEFVPWLSILDVMMFNSKENILNMLENYTLK